MCVRKRREDNEKMLEESLTLGKRYRDGPSQC